MRKGFTLTEIIVAMLILSLAIAGIFGMFVMGRKPVAVIRRRAEGMNLAREATEELKSNINFNDFASFTSGDTSNTANDPGNFVPFTALSLPADFASNWGGVWYYLIDNRDVDNDGTVDYKMISVKVEWNEPTE